MLFLRGISAYFDASDTPACYPSTAESGKWSLLCETSLTQCPPLYRPRSPCLRTSPGIWTSDLATWKECSHLASFVNKYAAESLDTACKWGYKGVESGETLSGGGAFSDKKRTLNGSAIITTPSPVQIIEKVLSTFRIRNT
ncbi:hypothetical protein SASPL_146449 [Salvia splendens]|uniref:Uncharacterized protein n=1 Tax=Salvia splendens TaxID=180675 RepID=A0A8X8WDW3_SALSN|nr:hypothetical protein SASPL_146449 [Salvia splendens]